MVNDRRLTDRQPPESAGTCECGGAVERRRTNAAVQADPHRMRVEDSCSKCGATSVNYTSSYA